MGPADRAPSVKGTHRVVDVVIAESDLEWRFSGPGGPGGQHANTSNTRVEVVFNIADSTSLDEATRSRLMAALGPSVRVVCAATRSQHRNREMARELLEARVRRALVVTPARRATRPSRAAAERRLAAKRTQAARKQRRRWRPHDE